jgi:hypothetical protein
MAVELSTAIADLLLIIQQIGNNFSPGNQKLMVPKAIHHKWRDLVSHKSGHTLCGI